MKDYALLLFNLKWICSIKKVIRSNVFFPTNFYPYTRVQSQKRQQTNKQCNIEEVFFFLKVRLSFSLFYSQLFLGSWTQPTKSKRDTRSKWKLKWPIQMQK